MSEALEAAARGAFPGIRFTVDNVVAEGDQAAISWVATGVQSGPLPGLPPTGKSATVLGCNTMHIANGKVTDHWVYFDRLAMLMQLGAIPAPQS